MPRHARSPARRSAKQLAELAEVRRKRSIEPSASLLAEDHKDHDRYLEERVRTAAADALLRLEAAASAELSFYRAHHRNRLNWWLHACAVPVEWTSWLILVRLVAWWLPYVLQSWIALLVLAATRSMVLAGAQIPLAALSDCAVRVCGVCGGAHVLAAAAICWLVSWMVQVGIGHWLVERNQPGMATSLTALSVLLSVSMAWDSRAERVRDEGKRA